MKANPALNILLPFVALLLPVPLYAQGVSSAQQYDSMGSALADKGFYAQALEYFKAAVQSDPYDWQGFQNMGNAYLKLNDASNARDAFSKSLQINPNNPTVKLTLDNLAGGFNPVPSAPLPAFSVPNQPIAPNQPPAASITAPPSPSQPLQPYNSQPMPTNPTVAQPFTPSTTTIPQPIPVPPAVTPISQPLSKPFQSVFRAGGQPIGPFDRSRFWLKLEGAYNFSLLSDLMDSTSIENQMIASNGWSGSSQMDRTGIEGGIEAGYSPDPNNGFSLGAGYIRLSDYNLTQNLRNGSPADFEKEDFYAYVVPLSLNYYFFLPDTDGRFFIAAGGSYDLALVRVNDDFNYLIAHPGSSDVDSFGGDLTGSGFGGQLVLGREFRINSFLGLSVFARGRYAVIGNLTGMVDRTGNPPAKYGLAKFPDGEVHAIDVSLIDGKNATYASLDLTGFDAGLSLAVYP